ncbi:MAG: hypothetical protein RDV48_10240 [Candidatus Eremiobacteraeota bacterium]|nr:hypothetical protein [Candidatus Eremiobacteraeota bacterium]
MMKNNPERCALCRALFFFLAVPLLVYFLCHLEYVFRYGTSGFFYQQAENLLYLVTLAGHDPQSSPWWSWMLLMKPQLLYKDTFCSGSGELFYSAVVLLGNPLLWWASIPAVIGLASRAFREELPLFVFFSLVFEVFLWVLSPRNGYIYYILNFTPLMMIAVSYYLQLLWGRGKWGKAIVWLFGAASILSFVYFSPLLYGTPVCAEGYGQFRLLGTWSI